MIVFINGAFGIGKSSVARELRRRLRPALVYNPEFLGVLIQRSARIVGWDVGDFQDLRAWRVLTVWGIRCTRALAPTVIVPMAFSDAGYLDEIRTGIQRFESRVHHLCLVAPLEVVRDRLRSRGADRLGNAWEFRRAAECCAAHRSEMFAERVVATDAPREIVSQILRRLTAQTSTSVRSSG